MLYLVNFYGKKETLRKFIVYMVNIFQEEYKEKSGQNNGIKLPKKKKAK